VANRINSSHCPRIQELSISLKSRLFLNSRDLIMNSYLFNSKLPTNERTLRICSIHLKVEEMHLQNLILRFHLKLILKSIPQLIRWLNYPSNTTLSISSIYLKLHLWQPWMLVIIQKSEHQLNHQLKWSLKESFSQQRIPTNRRLTVWTNSNYKS
jgi:hypothetical protein